MRRLLHAVTCLLVVGTLAGCPMVTPEAGGESKLALADIDGPWTFQSHEPGANAICCVFDKGRLIRYSVECDAENNLVAPATVNLQGNKFLLNFAVAFQDTPNLQGAATLDGTVIDENTIEVSATSMIPGLPLRVTVQATLTRDSPSG